jgi:mono/diheme cytochrome c family protein
MKRCSPAFDRSSLTACAVALFLIVGHPPAAASSVENGHILAQRLCAACHAIGRAERSPIPVAPAFRRMEPRVDLEQLVGRLQDGIIAGHPEMPAFKLKEDEARALVAYMRSLQGN